MPYNTNESINMRIEEKRKIIRVGNSVAVTIPRAWVEYYERKNGKLAEVFIETNGKLTIHPILKEVQIK